MDKNSTALYKKMQAEVESYQNLQKCKQIINFVCNVCFSYVHFSFIACVKVVKQRALLESQLNENKCVLEELNLLGPENKVFKLFGPVLVKQDLEDSRQNVAKRIEYISKELKSSTDTLENMYVN